VQEHPLRSGAVVPQLIQPEVQAYWHSVPLQVTEDAFVVLQTSPHAVQFFGSAARLVHVLLAPVPHVVSVQTQAPPLHVGVGCAHVVPATSCPMLPQVHGVLVAALQPT
jgi:hypothetical protein